MTGVSAETQQQQREGNMRQGQFKNRSRNRGNRRPSSPLSRVYESNGPDVKVRGTAQHVAEKYLQLARDALSSGDTVMGESYYQYAEHYLRIVAAAQSYQQQQHGTQPQPYQARRPESEDDAYEDGDDGMGAEETSHAPAYSEQPRMIEQPRMVEAEPERQAERRSPPPQPHPAPQPQPAASEPRAEAGEGKKNWDGHQPDFLRRSSPAPAANGTTRARRSRARRPSSETQAAEGAPAPDGDAPVRETPESVS